MQITGRERDASEHRGNLAAVRTERDEHTRLVEKLELKEGERTRGEDKWEYYILAADTLVNHCQS
jgi:hypothetical protein